MMPDPAIQEHTREERSVETAIDPALQQTTFSRTTTVQPAGNNVPQRPASHSEDLANGGESRSDAGASTLPQVQDQQQRGPSFPPLNQATGYYPSHPPAQQVSSQPPGPVHYYPSTQQAQIAHQHSAQSSAHPGAQYHQLGLGQVGSAVTHHHHQQQQQQQVLYAAAPLSGIGGAQAYGQVGQGFPGQVQPGLQQQQHYPGQGSIYQHQQHHPQQQHQHQYSHRHQSQPQAYHQMQSGGAMAVMGAYNHGLTLPPMQPQQGTRSPRPSTSGKLSAVANGSDLALGGHADGKRSSSSPVTSSPHRRGPPSSLHNTPLRNQTVALPSPAQIQYGAQAMSNFGNQRNGTPMYAVMASPSQQIFGIPVGGNMVGPIAHGYQQQLHGGPQMVPDGGANTSSPTGMRLASMQQDPFLGGPQYMGLTPGPMDSTFAPGVHASIERVVGGNDQGHGHGIGKARKQTGSPREPPPIGNRAVEQQDHEMDGDRDEKAEGEVRDPESARRRQERASENLTSGFQGSDQHQGPAAHFEQKPHYFAGQGDKFPVSLPPIQTVLSPNNALGSRLAPMQPHDRQTSGGSTASEVSGIMLPVSNGHQYTHQYMEYQPISANGYGQPLVQMQSTDSGRQIFVSRDGHMVQAPELPISIEVKQESRQDNPMMGSYHQQAPHMLQPQQFFVSPVGANSGFQTLISPTTGAVQFVQMTPNGQGQSMAYAYALAPHALHGVQQQQQPPASFARQNAFSYHYSDAEETTDNIGGRLRRMSETSLEDTDQEQAAGRGLSGRPIQGGRSSFRHASSGLEQIGELPEAAEATPHPSKRKSPDYRPKTGRPKKSSIKLMESSLAILKKTHKKKAVSKGALPGSARTPALTPGSLLPPIDPNNITYTSWSDDKQTETVRRECFTCGNRDPPSWRRSPLNSDHILCNRCGIYERSHGVPRPVLEDELDTIAQTNRAAKSVMTSKAKPFKKATAAAQKKKRNGSTAKSQGKSSIASVSAAAGPQESEDVILPEGDEEDAEGDDRENTPLSESGATQSSPSGSGGSPRTPWSAKANSASHPTIAGNAASARRTRSSGLKSPDNGLEYLELKDTAGSRYQSALQGSAPRMFEHNRHDSFNTTSTYDESAERGL